MPNIKSAKKSMRTSEESRVRNVAVKSRVKAVRRKFLSADDQTASQVFKSYCSELDKAAKKGVIKRNTAIRRKSRAAARIKAKA